MAGRRYNNVATQWRSRYDPMPKEPVVRASVRKLGNSAGVIIPRSMLAELGLTAGASVDMTLDDGRLILAPARNTRRAGWADASRGIAESGDDAPVWPEFDNADDDTLAW
jgi:antitoxin MazE